MPTYAQIPVSRFAYLLGELNKSTKPPSFLIKKLPGIGVLHMVRTAYPDAGVITLNTLETGTMPEKMLRQALTQNPEKVLIVDVDTDVATVEHELSCAMRDFIDNGNRLIIVSSGEVIVPDIVINRVLATAVF